MKILNLIIKKKWFDMICCGQKQEEYREIKEYWVTRLIDFKHKLEWSHLEEFINDLKRPYNRHDGPDYLFGYFLCSFKHFDAVRFKNGYQRDSPTAMYELKKIEINTGDKNLGAEPGKFYFVLKLGKLI